MPYEITFQFDADDGAAALEIGKRIDNGLRQLWQPGEDIPRFTVERIAEILTTRLPYYGYQR